MVTFSKVTCPKCGEWRETLITLVIDPLGERYYCGVCAHEFKESDVLREAPRDWPQSTRPQPW
jgi:ribosomal protein S27AE